MWMPRLPEVFAKPDQPELLEQLLGDAGDPLGVRERRTRLRVQVDAQLVGVVDVAAPDRPRVEHQRAHVRAPHRHRDLGRADLVGRPAGGEGDLDRLEVVGSALGHPLLVERVGVLVGASGRQRHALAYAGGPALQRRRPVPERTHQPVLDAREVLGDHQLGDLAGAFGRLVDHPVRAGHPDAALARLDLDRGCLGHATTLAATGGPSCSARIQGRSRRRGERQNCSLVSTVRAQITAASRASTMMPQTG